MAEIKIFQSFFYKFISARLYLLVCAFKRPSAKCHSDTALAAKIESVQDGVGRREWWYGERERERERESEHGIFRALSSSYYGASRCACTMTISVSRNYVIYPDVYT
jgi:hypothetical protein